MLMTVRPVPPSEASPELKPLYDALRAKYVTVPSSLQAVGSQPHLLASIIKQMKLMEKGVILPARMKDLMSYAAAQEFSCSYCVGSAMMILRINGYSEREISALKSRSEAMEFDTNTRRLLSFVRLLARNPDRVTPAEIADLRAAGFSNAVIISAAALVASSGFSTRMNGVLGVGADGMMQAANSPVGRRLLIPLMRFMMRRAQPPPETVPA